MACALGLVTCAVVFGCSPGTPLLSSSHPSAESLATAVLDALEHRDGERLRGLALNEAEFRGHVWPELPAARPERNLPFSYVWVDLHQKSEAALVTTVARHGGSDLTLVGVTFEGETTRYPSYEVRRETTLLVRTAQGTQQEIRLFGSSLVKDGMWKVFSYVVDE